MIVGAERLAEVVVVGVAGALRDVADLVFLVLQQFFGAFHPQLQHILIDGKAILLAKQLCQVLDGKKYFSANIVILMFSQ